MSFTHRITALAAVGISLAAAGTTHAALAYALNDENVLIGFDTTTPSTVINSVALRSAANQPLQDLIGIDFRPSNGLLYGVGRFGAVYTLNPLTGVGTQVSTLSADATDATSPFTQVFGSRFGFDFNPVPDRLRITSDANHNLRVNVDTGATITDGALNFPAGGNPNVIASAYTNNDANPATGTTLYSIDSNTNLLYIQTPPNDGTQVFVGSLGIDVTNISGFDILTDVAGNNFAFAALQTTTNPASQLYSINLTTGVASLISTIGGGDRIDGLAIVQPVPEPAALAALAGAGLLFVRRRRGA